MSEITALYADENGEIFDAPGFGALGCLADTPRELTSEDLIPLPEGADLMYLPNRQALAKSPEGEMLPLVGEAVAAILPAGYTRLYLPACGESEGAETLPLYGYTAVALYKDEIYAAALATDTPERWDPLNYNTRNLKKLIARTKKDLPRNPIIEHLANCALKWHCLTAQNIFYRRWEGGIPVSPNCNARCLGCISLQPSGCCPSPQERINFRPTAEEIAAVGVYHLSTAPEAIVSFGQGCDGEPSLEADTVAEAIGLMRQKTAKGQININTNAGFTSGIKKIVTAGLDSMRVSIISANKESYGAYYRAGYGLEKVKESVAFALERGVHVSLNLLTMPGFNDREEEIAAWREFLRELPVNMAQIRNLNIDPTYFWQTMPKAQGKMLGVRRFLAELREANPRLTVASFSHYIKKV